MPSDYERDNRTLIENELNAQLAANHTGKTQQSRSEQHKRARLWRSVRIIVLHERNAGISTRPATGTEVLCNEQVGCRGDVDVLADLTRVGNRERSASRRKATCAIRLAKAGRPCSG